MHKYKNLKVDLTNCDKEPIHMIGRIQPQGFLLVLNPSSLVIEQISGNVSQFLDTSPEVLLGNCLKSLFSKDEYAAIEKQLKNENIISPQLIEVQGRSFFGFIHNSSGKIILECEPYVQISDKESIAYHLALSQFSLTLNSLDSLESASDLLADFVQSFLDYDRVLIFRFDLDWNAETISEKIKPGIHSYSQHHFPASDIPVPARALLKKKHSRQIPDVSAQPVEIIPYHNPTTGAPTDILLSELRNPSQIHLEYLNNMNVKASISFSLMVRGKLWGLISCSNETPKFINFWKRQIIDLAAKTYSNVVLALQEKRDYHTFEHYKNIEATLIDQIHKSKDISKGLFNQPITLYDITECEGVAFFLDQKLVTLNKTPQESQIMEILDWLSKNNTDRIFYTRQLSKFIENAENYKKEASGLLALEISRYTKEYILFFKPETIETKIWAGNPEKPVAREDFIIHPRKSFEKWVEEVKGKSLPWTINELEITQTLAKDIMAIRLKNQATQLEGFNKELQQISEKLKAKNNQLEDFAHIITHNLRAPMSNIHSLYELYLQDPNQENGAFVMEKIKMVSDNMATTIEDLYVILQTRMGHQVQQEAVDLLEVIEKEKQNLGAVITETQAEIKTELLVSHITIPKVYIESIMHNLLSNALKYRSSKRRPLILIKSWLYQEELKISVSDNGLGMDLDKIGPKVFGLYKVFHENKDAKGLGLYLTKLQVESLGGKILVESKPDQGTSFTVCFKL